MKFLVVLACALAAASAGHLYGGHGGLAVGHGGFTAGHAGPAYAGPLHLPVINGEGVPVDTADVQHARAAHLSQQSVVHARNGDHAGYAGYGGYGPAGHGVVVGGPAGVFGGAHGGVFGGALAGHGGGFGGVAHAVPAAYPTTHAGPVIANGVPLDTPEVAAAAANHLAAHHEALARASHAAHGAHYRKRRGVYAGHGFNAGAYHGGLFAGAHAAAAAAHSAGFGLAYAAPQPAYHGPIHLPVINGEGVPVDTADVQHARAAHYGHVATVQHRNGDFAHGGGGYDAYGYGGYAGHGGHY